MSRRRTFESLTEAAVAVLETAPADAKADLSRAIAALWRDGEITGIGAVRPPDRPARPARPRLLMPRDMPRRRGAGPAKRIAFLHALAHIELNAIDLAWDLIARFADPALPREFHDDWVRVADEEARHFSLLAGLLDDAGAAYGDLPAHDGLWEAAAETADDILARIAIVPMVLEARGLDIAPDAIERLGRAGDEASVRVLEIIARDEETHVGFGVKWFDRLCAERGLDPADTFRELVRFRFKGVLKPPFAEAARERAGFPKSYYEPLAAGV